MNVDTLTALMFRIEHYMDTAPNSAKENMAAYVAACLVLDERFSIVYTGNTDKKEGS